MRSVKTTGGLTRGSDMDELQWASWLLSMPACEEINAAMQNLTEISFSTSEQHKEMSLSRLKRDRKKTLKQYFPTYRTEILLPVFSLRNILTGVVAQAFANVERAESIAKAILSCMENESPLEYMFKRKNQAIPLETSMSFADILQLYLPLQSY